KCENWQEQPASATLVDESSRLPTRRALGLAGTLAEAFRVIVHSAPEGAEGIHHRQPGAKDPDDAAWHGSLALCQVDDLGWFAASRESVGQLANEPRAVLRSADVVVPKRDSHGRTPLTPPSTVPCGRVPSAPPRWRRGPCAVARRATTGPAGR